MHPYFVRSKAEVNPAIHCEWEITQVSLKDRGTGTVSGNINCNSFDRPKFKVALMFIIFCLHTSYAAACASDPCKVKCSFSGII